MNMCMSRYVVMILLSLFILNSTPVHGGMLNEIQQYLDVSGLVEVEASFIDDADIATDEKKDESNLDVTSVELGLDIFPMAEWISGRILLLGEDLDEDDNIFIDEAYITLEKEGFPLYLVAGKNYAPFGVFENHLVNDTLLQDLYEINPSQVRIGIRPGWRDIDVSLTLYKGTDLIEKIYESVWVMENPAREHAVNSLGEDVEPLIEGPNHVNSVIANVSLNPCDLLTLSGYYSFEEGDDDNNHTAGGALTARLWRFTLDLEAVFALEREEVAELNVAQGIDRWENLDGFKERAWMAALAFQATDLTEMAARYEDFDHGAEKEIEGSLDWRFSIGGSRNIWSHEKLGMSLDLAAEYRYSKFEKGDNKEAHDQTNEFFVQLAFSF